MSNPQSPFAFQTSASHEAVSRRASGAGAGSHMRRSGRWWLIPVRWVQRWRGRRKLREGDLEGSLAALSRSGDRTALLTVGDAFLERGDLLRAEQAYYKAEHPEGFCTIGRHCLDSGDVVTAVHYLVKGGAALEAAEWKRLGDRCLDEGIRAVADDRWQPSPQLCLYVGRMAYHKAGMQPDPLKLGVIGRAYVGRGLLDAAEEIFAESDDREGLVLLADRRLRAGDAEKARSLYQHAGLRWESLEFDWLPCFRCGGRGTRAEQDLLEMCPSCNGSGKMPVRKGSAGD